VILLILLFFAAADTPAPPRQPLPFSHKQHAGTMKLQCKTCHPNPDPGESMTIASPSACIQCHPAFAKNSQPIPWVRVYQIPSYVNFSHRVHLETGNTCADCHGKVAERDQLFKEGNISMGGCMQCHQAKKVSIDCTFCHEQR
jgi:hypothetical protein